MADRRRVFKVAERIQSLIGMQLLRLTDPRFSLVTITSVVVTPDLRLAKIYWMVSGGEQRAAEAEQAFEHAVGLFRREIGKELGLRFVPELRFYYDNTLDVCDEVDRLLGQVKQRDPAV